GENPHQGAALYAAADPAGPGLAGAEQLHGKEMSYNNYVDGDAALRAAYDFTDPCVAIIKHANPCGIAVGADIAEAHRKAHACDPVSAFGGVVAANRPVTAAMAEQLADVFTEVVAAPDFEPGALEVLTRKKNVRLLKVAAPRRAARPEARQISGGLLLQAADLVDAPGDAPKGWELRTGAPADAATLADLEFAWRAVRSVKSNAILLASDGATVGVGMGQVNRVDSVRLAITRAGAERVTGAVAASAAFFPFPDGLETLAEAGVRAVVQPGGSGRDAEVVAAAEPAGLPPYFTGSRHFFPGRRDRPERTGPRRQGRRRGHQGRPGGAGRRTAGEGHHPRAGHGAGRRRPGQPHLCRGQAPGLRGGRHRQHPPGPAGHRDPGRGGGGGGRAQRRPGVHRLHRAAA